MHKGWSIAVVVLALGACGGKHENGVNPSTPTGETPPASAAAEGNGWAKTPEADGTMAWGWKAEDDGDNSTTGLEAEPGGRGILAMQLPDGAKQATLRRFLVSYTRPGTATWSVFAADADGAPTGTALATKQVTIGDGAFAEAGEAASYTAASQVELDADVTLNGPFDLVFEGGDGGTAVGAIHGEPTNVYYAAPGAAPSPVPFHAFIRVILSNVQ